MDTPNIIPAGTIRILATSVLALMLCMSVTAQYTCTTAQVIGPGSHAVSGITGELPPLICPNFSGLASAGMWYAYTPVSDKTVTVTTAGSGVDTRVSVFFGGCADLTCLIGDDESGGAGASEAVFNAIGGTTYLIVFDDNWSAAGFTFQLIEDTLVVPAAEPVLFVNEGTTGQNGGSLTVVDMNGDHLDDIVAATSTSILEKRQGPGGSFTDHNYTFPAVQNPASFSFAAGDMDNNGYTDLLYGGSGPTFMLAGDDGNGFTEWSGETYLFAQRTNMADIDNDGNLDGFYCHDFGTNYYYFSDGMGGFTEGSGALSVVGGNYGSIWIDFDGDGDVDMHNTKCGGGNGIDELYRNDGNGQFTNVAAEMGFAVVHQAWSTAWGDFDNDGDMDAFVGRSGSPQHMLMRNDGDVFTDVILGSGAEGASSGIEWRTHDFNNDGYLDILGQSQILYGFADMHFELASGVPYSGPIGDLNDDGFLDMVSSSVKYLNSGNQNHWLKVSLEGTVSNRMGVGARVRVITTGEQQIRDIISGDGCRYMSTLNAHFGLGANSTIEQVEVRWPSGIVDVITAPSVDGTLVVQEGLSTGILPQERELGLRLFPNPVRDRLSVMGVWSSAARLCITDNAGRAVLESSVLMSSVDVSALAHGTYVATVTDGADRMHLSFVKE